MVEKGFRVMNTRVCGILLSCSRGEHHVNNEKILGISRDGCFAEYIKVPGHRWKTNTKDIRPEVAAPKNRLVMRCTRQVKQMQKVKPWVLLGWAPLGNF